jgi:hypothetical protein
MVLYLLKSAACMGIFLLFYKLLLEKENMHIFKRFYLIATLIAALVIPGLVFVEYIEPVVTTYSNYNNYIETSTPLINELPARDIAIINWSLLAWTIYYIGLGIFGVRFLRNLFQIINRIRKNTKFKERFSIKVLLLEQLPPHTFFKYIFLNKEKFETDAIPKEVLLHEEIHAKQHHSIDVLFIELLQVVLWFNPLVYFFKKSIKLNHEFLADSAVIKATISTSNYQNTLLSYLSQDSLHKYQSVKMANAINYSSIKKRFKVMKNKTSKKAVLLRSLLLLPLLALMLYGFSETKLVEKSSPEIQERLNEDLENINEPPLNNYTDKFSNRTIELAGLVLDNESLLPVENAKIYNSEGKLLSKTDGKGFYYIEVNSPKAGEISFNLTVKKDGYTPFVQKEHWGDLQGRLKASLFMGLKKQESNSPVFSDLFPNIENLRYPTIQQKYNIVKTRLNFEKKLNKLKEDNQHIFFEIDDSFYITNSHGWIKINSKSDLIFINDDKVIRADKINGYIKRKQITGMTPITNQRAQYAVYTIPVDHAVKPIQKTKKELISKYNALAKKYNASPIEKRTIPLKDLEVLESIYRKMSNGQKEKAQPFPECLPKNIQKGASKEQMEEYKILQDKYSTDINGLVNKKDIDRMEYLYSLMSNEQKATVVPFPDFPEPPPVPEAPNPIDKIIKNQEDYDENRKERIAQLLPNSIHPTSTNSHYVSGNGKLGKIEIHRSPKPDKSNNKEFAYKVPTHSKAPTSPSPETPIYTSSKNTIIQVQTSNSPKTNAPAPPLPPEPMKPIDHVIHMAKKGATFYYDGKKISSDKAIELIKKNESLNISTTKSSSKNPQVKISKEPIKIGANTKKENELLKYARELEKKNAQFYIDNKYSSSKKALSVIAKKVYDRVETFPYTSKTPEVRIYTKPIKGNKASNKEKKAKSDSGFIEINGETLFYNKNKDRTTYFNRYGDKVDENGNILNNDSSKRKTPETKTLASIKKIKGDSKGFYKQDNTTNFYIKEGTIIKYYDRWGNRIDEEGNKINNKAKK